MKKKRLIGTLLASSIALTAAFSGCSLVSSNSKADMSQIVAKVDITKAKGISDKTDKQLIEKYEDVIGTKNIYKDELIAYFLNYGSTYLNYGYSNSETYEALLDGLVENAILTQYAIAYLLNEKVVSSSNESTVISQYSSKTYVKQLEYLLTDDEAEDPEKDVKIAQYNLYVTLNTTLDSLEKRYLKEEDSTSGSGSRAVPTGVDAEQNDFYPANEDGTLNYNVYTGYEAYSLSGSGDYINDALEGTTKTTRAKAYNDFLDTFIKNELIDPHEDDIHDIFAVKYFEKEYASRLENRVINKYYDLYEKEQEAELTDEGKENAYSYLQKVYNKLMGLQEKATDSFSSTFSKMSDTSFVLYAADTEGEGTYGFVYNILLPFSTTQSARLTALKSKYADKAVVGGYKVSYYNERNKILQQITTTDQRAAWFNGATDYSFKAEDAGLVAGTDYYAGSNDRQYLFFENNLTKTDRYKQIEKYMGQYAYNGRVVELNDGGYQLLPVSLTIDDMLEEFIAYVNYVLGDGSASYTVNANYYDEPSSTYDSEAAKNFWKDDSEKEINYENYIYATGAVNVGEDGADFRSNLLNKDSTQYKALAAVNELQYAYTTDTGVLSQYIGYSVTLGDTTGYIKEFETAAHEAIERGAGAFNVCAGDYGWHLIYVTYTFSPDGGEVYTPNWEANVKVEGTFEYMFYEWLKNNDIPKISTTRRTQIMTQFKQDSTVNKIKSAYQNLLDSGN